MKKIQSSNPAKYLFFDIFLFEKYVPRTLYLLGPYKGKLRYFYIFIHKMLRRNYRVVYLQPCPEVLSNDSPEFLGSAITQAIQYIQADSRKHPENEMFLVGISLGSYLGLNVQLEVPLKKFAVVAGGAPLLGVFNSSKMFKKQRTAINKMNDGKKALSYKWQPYDEAYKKRDLSGHATLFINSRKDRLISPKLLNEFLKSYQKTGVEIINRQRGSMAHVPQALSINWRAKEIDKFFKNDSKNY